MLFGVQVVTKGRVAKLKDGARVEMVDGRGRIRAGRVAAARYLKRTGEELGRSGPIVPALTMTWSTSASS